MAGPPFADFFEQTVWPRLELPVAHILVHLAVTVLSVLSMAVSEGLVYILGWEAREIPGVGVTYTDWLRILEILAATGIISVGIVRAVIALWKEP